MPCPINAGTSHESEGDCGSTRLHASTGSISRVHPCLYAGQRTAAGRTRDDAVLPGHATDRASHGSHAGAGGPDLTTAGNGRSIVVLVHEDHLPRLKPGFA